MEFLEGESLSQHMRRTAGGLADHALGIARQIAHAMAAVHQRESFIASDPFVEKRAAIPRLDIVEKIVYALSVGGAVLIAIPSPASASQK